MFELWILLACSTGFAFLTAAVAGAKGRAYVPWGVYGAVLAPIALIHAIAIRPAPAVTESAVVWNTDRFGLPGKRVACLHCGALSPAEAVLCRNCRQPMEDWSAASNPASPATSLGNAVCRDAGTETDGDSRQWSFDWRAGRRPSSQRAAKSDSPSIGGIRPGADPDRSTASHVADGIRIPPPETSTRENLLIPSLGALSIGIIAVAILAWPDQTAVTEPETAPRRDIAQPTFENPLPNPGPQDAVRAPDMPPPIEGRSDFVRAETEPPAAAPPEADAPATPPPTTAIEPRTARPPEPVEPGAAEAKARPKDESVEFSTMVREALRESRSQESPAQPSKKPQTITASGELVAMVQERLRLRGYDCGKVDGRVGPATAEKIREFQRDNGMPPTGEIDLELMQRLGLYGKKIDAFRTDTIAPTAR